MESTPQKIVQDRAIPLHQEPGQAGVKAQPESQGEPGLSLGFGRVGQGIEEKNGEAMATGPTRPGLAWPPSKLANPGKEKQKSLACTSHGWLGSKVGQACQGTSAGLARIKLQGLHTCSGFTLSGQSYRILQSSQVKRTPQDAINEFIIQKSNPLVVVDFRSCMRNEP